ncbi:MAG: hypothetical protein ACRCU3_09340 [Eubacteriaceae bacterium]
MEKRKKKRVIIILCIFLVAGIGLGAFYYYQMMNKSPLARDENALGGLLPGKTPSEITELLNQKVKEGMVDIGIAGEPIFEYNGKNGKLGIENVPGNNYAFQVDLVLKETGETLYSSGLIEPGYYIEFVALNKKLEQGKHGATAIFTTYSLDGAQKEIGKTKVEILFNVMDGQYY